MKFGLFYELPVPKPWDADTEARLFHEALDQIEEDYKLGKRDPNEPTRIVYENLGEGDL